MADEEETAGTEDIYDEDQLAEEMEEDEIDPQEAGFMEGYLNPEQAEKELEKTLAKKKVNKKNPETNPKKKSKK